MINNAQPAQAELKARRQLPAENPYREYRADRQGQKYTNGYFVFPYMVYNNHKDPMK
ncbi:MAG: hypothetical protein GX094_05490 [Clostridiales bacterium]|jgi:hypothetical protein|nr:hypothetical protein [Clostridiales bacterium]